MKQVFAGEALEAVLAAAQRPPSNEDSRTDRMALLGGLRRSFVTVLSQDTCRIQIGRIAAAGVVFAATLVFVSGFRAVVPEPVKTDAGLLSGTSAAAPGVRVFKGIPFAAPPVGELRWRAPQPMAKWTGVRTADTGRRRLRAAEGRGTSERLGRSSRLARGERGLPVSERLDGRSVGVRAASGDGLDLRRRVHRRRGLEPA